MAPAPPPDLPAAQPRDARSSPAETILLSPTSAKGQAIHESDEEEDQKSPSAGADHWSVQLQDIGVEAPPPTLRPSGVQLAMDASAAFGPGSDGSGAGESSHTSLHLLASSPSWTGTVDDKTSGQAVTFQTSRSIFTPMSPDITVHLHSPSVRSTRASWYPKPEEIAEVQMPKYFSGQTNACSKHPSMLQNISPMREAGVLKTLIHASSDEAKRQQTDVSELQRAFNAHVAAQGIRGGSQILIFTSVLLLIYRGFWILHRVLAESHSCEHWPLRMGMVWRVVVCCVEGLWWATCMIIFILCHVRSNAMPEVGKQQLEMHEPSLERTVWLYHSAVVMFLMHVHLMSLPPLSPTCRDVIRELQCTHSEQEALDCGLQGPSHMMFAMIMVFLAPHVIPRRRILVASLVLYLVFYVAVSVVTLMMGARAFFDWADVLVGFVLLFAMSGIALYVKNAIIKKMWDGYAAIFSRKKSSMMLLTILEYMLPNHLVLPMLRAPTSVIANRIETASVLFLEVVNFKRLPMKNPEALLNFLNALFTLIDGACEDHNVTKVETVGEEYVACVGVVPADVASTLTFGHSRALIRMIRLCTLLLRVQEDEEVMLKMGLHSGPVVAGVIGQKLPRFRLFGDTVNMAARMMQTGVDGELQFSRETLQILKQSPVEVRATQREGLIDIKGKGKVIAFLLAWRGNSQGMDVRQHAQEMRSVSTTSRGGVISAEPSQDNSQSTSRKTLSIPKTFSIQTQPSQRSLRQSIERLSKAGKAFLDSSAVTGTCSHSVHLAFNDTGSEASEFGKDMTPHRKYQMAMKVVQEQNENNLKATSQAGSKDTPRPPVSDDAIDETCAQSQQQLSMRRTTKTSSDSLFKLQRSDITDFWDQYYVGKLFGKNARQRLDVHVTVVGVLSVLEAVIAMLLGFASDEDNALVAHPLVIFALARVGMIAFLIALRVLASDRLSPAVIMKPFVLKFRLFSLLMMTLLAHVSYAVLMLDSEPLTGHMTLDEAEDHLQEKPLRIRIWSLLFLTQYFSLLVEIRLPSEYVLVFTVISTGLNIGVAFVPGLDIGLLMRKDILFFCAMNLIGLRLSLLRAKNCLMDHEGSLNVEKTTAQLEGILRGFIPPLVLEDLKRTPGATLPTHSFKHATVVQSDLVGFTALASKWNPEDVVRFIRDLFGRFDELTDHYQIWKIETVGDAYIAGQAEPPLTDVNEPTMVVRFALSIIKIVEEVAKKMQRDHEGAASISCRCGVHTGECIGGVVGERMQRYHLFGDLLSELDLLESTAGSGQVQVSRNCYRAIEDEWMRKCDESPSGMIPQPFRLKMREEEHLVTSKGKMVEYSQVGGGPTYLVDRTEESLSPLRLLSC